MGDNPCVRGSQGPPQVCWFAWTHRTQYRVILTVRVYYSERITKHNLQRENTRGKISEGNQSQASKTLLLVESPKTCLIPPAMDCVNTREVLPAREALETQCPGILLGDGHVDTLCLAYTKTPESDKKSRYLE